MEKNLIPFEGKNIRSVEHEGEMWFSIVDIIGALTESKDPRNYWYVLKKREIQLLTICKVLKLQAADGKFYRTDAANTEGVLRLIQSVPSPKAEPFKTWMAGLGKRELEEVADPELGFERLTELYKAKGYSDEWISQRLKSIEIRKELTDEWQKRGIENSKDYAMLTATIAKGTFGLTPSEHSQLKGLEKQNLRDNMTNLELLFSGLGEEISRQLTLKDDAQGFTENYETAQRGGTIAGQARENVEKQMGLKVVSAENFLKQVEAEKTEKEEEK